MIPKIISWIILVVIWMFLMESMQFKLYGKDWKSRIIFCLIDSLSHSVFLLMKHVVFNFFPGFNQEFCFNILAKLKGGLIPSTRKDWEAVFSIFNPRRLGKNERAAEIFHKNISKSSCKSQIFNAKNHFQITTKYINLHKKDLWDLVFKTCEKV